MEFYSVVEDRPVTAAIGRAYDIFERTDDAIESLHYALERNPKLAGFETDEKPVMHYIKLQGKPSIQLPTVTATYQIGDGQVFVRTIRIEHDGVIFHSAAFERE